MRWVCAFAIAAAVFAPSVAHAGTCETEAFRLASEHAKVWRGAGSPTVACGALPATGRAEVAGYYDVRTNTIHVLDERFIAHELGHAWLTTQARERGGFDLKRYAKIRGFPGVSIEVNEDYAETFSYTLGEWPDVVAPAPYRFQNIAGVPTAEQIERLRAKRLLPH